jgi:hypothetical protein
MKKAVLKIQPETAQYNKALAPVEREICTVLAEEITRHLSKAENKIWHGSPVWFLDGNPVVGYDKLKDGVRLLFWSGQSFDEPELKKEGSFKAAEKRYTAALQIKKKDLKRWLKKAEEIQWDYKHIVKNRGVLNMIAPAVKKHRIYTMSFAKVYPLYVAKVVKKGRLPGEVDQVIKWLTGYTQKQLEACLKKETNFETFFAEAPKLNPARTLIKGVICGVRIEEITDPLMREIRYLDKLVDDLARSRPRSFVL